MQKRILLLFLLNVFLLSAQAQSVDPLRATDAAAQQIWVDSIINNMTVEEKIGQLFMVQAYSNLDAKHEKTITDMIEKYHVGNLIFMQGTPEKQAKLNNKYQELSKVPLMIGFDGEWGLDMRLKNVYKFPWNMTLGAIRDNNLVEEFGKRIGEHCKRLGIHINFAPVVDVNINPKNPIIGNRSFGESKENVTEKAIAFTRGMQQVGVLANAKHFPGHGDTASDSHHTLPVLNFTKQRLDSIELYPYKKMFDAGVASVMTAHLSIPSLEQDPALPTSLSYNVTTKLLQEKLGFLGLVITDGLNMKGAANYSTSAEIDLAAILAGNDMLLIPQDVPGSVKLMKNALKNGMLTEERLEHSVRKILRAKYLVGLHNYKPVSEDNLQADLNAPKDEILHRKLIKNSITILKNTNGDIPVRNLEKHKIAYVSMGDSKGTHFVNMLQNYAKVDVVSDKNLATLQQKLEKYNLVIIGFHKSNDHPWKGYKFTNKELVWLQEIARKKNVILDIFASPYSLLQVKSFANIEGLLVSYQNSKLAQELSAQAIFGALDVNGKLPVSIKNEFGEGHGLLAYSLKRFEYSIPEDVGMSSLVLEGIDKRVDTILKQKMAPGVQVLVARHGKVIYNKSFGYHTHSKKLRVKNSDVYDLASLTKILASLPLIMKAEEEQVLPLSASLKDILPSFRNSNKETVTVKEILSHFGRLKAWIPFYKGTQDSVTGRNLSKFYSKKKSDKYQIKIAQNLYMNKSYQDSIYKYIKDADQRESKRYKYSDLGYYLFKKALEDTYHKPLNTLVDEEFYQSLGANRTSYLPLEKFKKSEIIPTEKDTYYRNQLLQGYVHDMGAAMQGGVGGHAGLFANANDVAKIMQMYLQKGEYGGRQYLYPETVEKFNKRYFQDKKVRRGLGFDKPQLNPKVKATCGCVSEESFGHSGFTGTYTWADPQSGIVYVFLSNRVYPNMDNRGLVRSNMRTKIQQVIQDAIIQDN
ncbi:MULTISPECIES: glycoside hydrolase family 3 N-terminal domain-containing protein [Tenacibaculum]|uniref:glycoside hydrolase family 3 N-terminal domain-containing protein n=1 Tax=Tenacibaculum TaxID=104267 RepID=UPI001F0A6B85|nr:MULTISPECIES: glycoside hydrolase family 3 N-terminal domain-containing protein [Tenacibaculum]MCH3882431.1 serine hydrolase [Tenacibaculum aquimarinum]MDO6600087.1 glycoside hydrolase family 3 N-terminal domain-containing protein [Tenacibaculum sp. 1_MG-2023]